MRMILPVGLFGFLLSLTVPLFTGCSTWGGKLNNTEGLDYYSRGDYDRALSSFETAARLNPDDSEVYYNIASTYQQQAFRYNQPALLTQAENYYRKSLEKNPTPETTVCCYRGLATVLHRKNADTAAFEALRGWEERNPASIEPKLEIAYLLEAAGRDAEAAEAFGKIAAYAPGDYRAFYKLGLLEERLGKNQTALEQLQTASRLNPSDQEIAQKVASLESKVRAGQTAAAGTSAPKRENKTTDNIAPPIQDPGWQSGSSAVAAAPPISLEQPPAQITQTNSSTNQSLGRTPEPPALAALPSGKTAASSLPDGTGANPFLQYPAATTAPSAATTAATAPPLNETAAVPQAASTAPTLNETAAAPQAAPPAPTLNAAAPQAMPTPSKKSLVGEMKSDPPQTSIAPF